jgi:hypothetical protein
VITQCTGSRGSTRSFACSNVIGVGPSYRPSVLGEGCGSQPLRGDRNQQGGTAWLWRTPTFRRLLNEANHASEPPPESAPQTSIRARSTVTRTLRLALAAIDSRPRFDTLVGTKPLEVRDDIGDH